MYADDSAEITPFESVKACSGQLRAESPKLEFILTELLLKHAQRVADCFARILILARLHQPFNEVILLDCQADVTNPHFVNFSSTRTNMIGKQLPLRFQFYARSKAFYGGCCRLSVERG